MRQEEITIEANVGTEYSKGRAVIFECWFQGTPICITVVSESDANYFKDPSDRDTPGGKMWQIWGKSVMITADGTGENAFPKIDNKSLRLKTPFGSFRIRKVEKGDQLIYGQNNYKGVFMEKIEEVETGPWFCQKCCRQVFEAPGLEHGRAAAQQVR